MHRLWGYIKALPRMVFIALGIIVCVIFLLYYPIGMLVVHAVDDDMNFSAGKQDIEGGSHAVAIAAALIDREVHTHHWTPNDPFFLPGAMLDRMPAFQQGIIFGLSRFAIELADQMGRTRGSSQIDPDLQKAAGLIKYSPTVWIFDFSTSLLPTASSERQYTSGAAALTSYNERVAAGKAPFERRADNLLETLDGFASDLGSSSAKIDDHINERTGQILDTDADKLYYFNKGQLYAYYLVMRELERDYADAIAEKQLQSVWKQTMESLHTGASLSNFFIFNASPDSQFMPNHLATQGFYLLEARTQLREITNILLK